MEARMYCTSGIYWLEHGDPEKAYEYLKHAILVYPDFAIAEDKLAEADICLRKKKIADERLRVEERRLEAERQRQNEIVRAQRRIIDQQNQKIAQERAAENQRQANLKYETCSNCMSDCAVNKHQYNRECYNACASRHGLLFTCMNSMIQGIVDNSFNQR
jgi:hypothetical protein